MVLIDTSALFALTDGRDAHHGEAVRILERLEDQGEELLLHTYILLEAFALIHRRHGLTPAIKVSRDLREVRTIAVDRLLHDEAVSLLGRRPGRSGRGPSLVDAVSFLIMRRGGLEEAFAFDPDFVKAGFRLATAP